jgi:SpoIIAA-like
VRVQGGGFVTREMLERAIDDVCRTARDAHCGAVLVDLRAVAGYETACLLAARQFLREAPGLGLQRIALIATSSVMHTASRLAAHTVAVELRTFEHERSALQWLHPASAAIPRPCAPSPATATTTLASTTPTTPTTSTTSTTSIAPFAP